MNAKKVLKRIAKIESLMLKVMERSSASAPQARELLREAQAAISRARKAVGLQASSGAAKNPPATGAKHRPKPTPIPSRSKRKLSVAGKKAASTVTKVGSAAKKAAAKSEQVIAKRATTTESAPVKVAKAPPRKVAKKAPAKKAAVNSTVKEATKTISAATKKAPAAKKAAAKPETVIARNAVIRKAAPVKLATAPTGKVTKKAVRRASVISSAKEATKVDQNTKQPAELEAAAEMPEQAVQETLPGDGTI